MRAIVDAELSCLLNLPSSGETAYSRWLDLGPPPVLESATLFLVVPALPDLSTGQTIALTLEDAELAVVGYGEADNAFASVLAPAGVTVIVGGESGSDAFTTAIGLPPSVRRYVRVKATAEAGAGTITEVATVELRF